MKDQSTSPFSKFSPELPKISLNHFFQTKVERGSHVRQMSSRNQLSSKQISTKLKLSPKLNPSEMPSQ